MELAVVEAGFTADRTAFDYGYDLAVQTFDADGYYETGQVLFQLKATEIIQKWKSVGGFVFDLDVRDYNVWTREPNPVFLILFDAAARVGYWQYVQRFFADHPDRRPRHGAKFVRLRIPAGNVVGPEFLAFARAEKNRIVGQDRGVITHGD